MPLIKLTFLMKLMGWMKMTKRMQNSGTNEKNCYCYCYYYLFVIIILL